jgi:hypothetical protein
LSAAHHTALGEALAEVDSPDRDRLRAVIDELRMEQHVALDASPTERLAAIRVVHQAILKSLAERDPTLAARYGAALQRKIADLDDRATVDDDNALRWFMVRSDELLFRQPKSSDDVDALRLTIMAQELVAPQRRAAGSTATHPPTRREVYAALLRRPGPSSHIDELALLRALDVPCAATVEAVDTFLEQVDAAQTARIGGDQEYTVDVRALRLGKPPKGFRLELALNEPYTYTATLSAEPSSAIAGEVWTSETGRHTRVRRGCWANVDVAALFAPLLTPAEERALADAVAARALVDGARHPGMAAFEKVIAAYTVDNETQLSSVAWVLAHAVRQHHPELNAHTQRVLVENFVPFVGDTRHRTLSDAEARDLVWLVLHDPTAPSLSMRKAALLQKVGRLAADSDPLRPQDDTEPTARRLLHLVRRVEPTLETAFVQKVRPAVCFHTIWVTDTFLRAEPREGSAEELRRDGADIVDALRAFGFDATLVDASSPATFTVDAVMPPASIIAGHHVRLKGDTFQIVHDACAEFTAQLPPRSGK